MGKLDDGSVSTPTLNVYICLQGGEEESIGLYQINPRFIFCHLLGILPVFIYIHFESKKVPKLKIIHEAMKNMLNPIF